VSLDLLHPHEAVERVLSATSPSTAEEVALSAALGRVLAADVTSREAVPGFHNSAMDGFAVRAADTWGARPDRATPLAIVDESRAGRPPAVTATTPSVFSTRAPAPPPQTEVAWRS